MGKTSACLRHQLTYGRASGYDDVAVRDFGLVLRVARLASFYGFAANRSTGAATTRGTCAGISQPKIG
jgi:hypothetical protein